jgi:hypothetical protein
LLGLKENVIIGHNVPVGTGLKAYLDLVVGSREELETLERANELLDRGRDTGGDGFTLPTGGDADALAEINRRLG